LVIIREALASDLPSIQVIINYYRLYTSYLWERSPITGPEMSSWLKEHQKAPYIALVAEQNDVLLGYATLSRFRPYSGYWPTAEDSIYLEPDFTGRGLGTSLMQELLRCAGDGGLRAVTAWIDSDNLLSVKFHEKFGFYHVGILKDVGILDNQAKNVIIMQCNLTDKN